MMESESTFRVYAEDVDHMGIMYHANYLAFFERARSDLLRNNPGISLSTLAEQGTHFAIYDVKLRYLSPARLENVVTIKTRCIQCRATMLEFIQTMENESEIILSEATIQVVCLNEKLKPKRFTL